MKLNIFTDPHLGTSRKANTTATSSARLNDALFEQAMKCCGGDGHFFVAGDLFDKSHNSERVIAQGIAVANRALILAGNHDEPNREDDVTSLQLVEKALPNQVIRAPKISEPYFTEPFSGVYAVPHHASQDLFMQALQAASEDAAVRGGGYLFLHCNRGFINGDQTTPDSTLVLADEDENTLLETFDKIFYGHEHRPASYKNGRVIVLGNTHPTGFADISDKFRYVLDTATGDVEQHLIWSEAEHFARLELGDPLPTAGWKFIEVHGAGTRQDVSKYVSEIWDTYPTAFAVRPVCQYTDDVKVDDQAVDFHDIPAIIENDLKGTDLLPLMQELRGSIA